MNKRKPRQKTGTVLKPSSPRKTLHLAYVTLRIPSHVHLWGSTPNEGPPFGVQQKCTPLTFQPITFLTHWITVQSSLPCLLSSLPASMSSRAFYLLQAERCLVVVGEGAGGRPVGAGPKLHPDSDNHLGLLHIT